MSNSVKAQYPPKQTKQGCTWTMLSLAIETENSCRRYVHLACLQRIPITQYIFKNNYYSHEAQWKHNDERSEARRATVKTARFCYMVQRVAERCEETRLMTCAQHALGAACS